ncbi:hypothetical protein IKE96_03840 [bacterium]|nr:hypothetical protein [bacterium]MBR2858292.1 hypothetical protein [bacterium]MBR2891049.1 hypothetical protein [Bacilli bacterium]MBR4003290.1 hypothetical protein [Clostridia bacterium]
MFDWDDEYEKFKIIIKGKYLKENNDSPILTDIQIKKEVIEGEYFFLLYTLLYYASLVMLDNDENANRQKFLDIANEIWMNAVKEAR